MTNGYNRYFLLCHGIFLGIEDKLRIIKDSKDLDFQRLKKERQWKIKLVPATSLVKGEIVDGGY